MVASMMTASRTSLGLLRNRDLLWFATFATSWIVLQANGVENVMMARMSSEEFTAAWHEQRAMRRLEGDLLLYVGPRVRVRG